MSLAKLAQTIVKSKPLKRVIIINEYISLFLFKNKSYPKSVIYFDIH